LRPWLGQFVARAAAAPCERVTLPRSLRQLTVYGNHIAALPEALVLHAAQAGLLLWRVRWSQLSKRLMRFSGLAIHLAAPK
jgi:hypothetical protein